jgi:hypothetical protein
MRHDRGFLSSQRQKLRQDADNKDKEALRLETKPYLLEQERVSNYIKAKTLRDESSKCREALKNLRFTTYRQQRAGWGGH